MKKGWPRKKLGDVCAFDKAQCIHRGLPYVGLEHIESHTARFIGSIEPQSVKSSTFRFSEQHVLYGRLRPYLNKALLPDFDGHCSTEIFPIKPCPELSREYLLYWLLADETCELINATCTGARMPRADMNEVLGFEFPLPPLREQQRIVDILDEAFDDIATAKANAEKNLQNARALFESHLQSVFTRGGKRWKRVRIDDACETIMDCVNKTAPKVDEPTPFKMIRTTNVRNGRVNLDSVNYVTEAVYRVWTRRQIPQPGDVLLTREAPMGEVGMLMTDDSVFLGQRIVSYRAHPAKLNNRFLLYALQSKDLQEQIHALASGSTVQHMRVPDSKNLELLLPRLTEQMATVATLDSLGEETQRLVSLYQRKLAALDELKRCLLHQAFAGELTAQPQRPSVVIPFPLRIPNITTTDLHAGIVAIAFQLHEKNERQSYFGHVKAEKISHMVEAHVGIDLGRKPVKDAAGPDDFPHLLRVEHRAKNAGFFSFAGTAGSRYKLIKYRKFDELIGRTRSALGQRNTAVDALLKLMLPMDTQQAEIFSTVYAAWNNLLLDKLPITDDAIVFEAREDWHPDKLNIERSRFLDAIKWMKERGVVPTGKGKKVSRKEKQK